MVFGKPSIGRCCVGLASAIVISPGLAPTASPVCGNSRRGDTHRRHPLDPASDPGHCRSEPREIRPAPDPRSVGTASAHTESTRAGDADRPPAMGEHPARRKSTWPTPLARARPVRRREAPPAPPACPRHPAAGDPRPEQGRGGWSSIAGRMEHAPAPPGRPPCHLCTATNYTHARAARAPSQEKRPAWWIARALRPGGVAGSDADEQIMGAPRGPDHPALLLSEAHRIVGSDATILQGAPSWEVPGSEEAISVRSLILASSGIHTTGRQHYSPRYGRSVYDRNRWCGTSGNEENLHVPQLGILCLAVHLHHLVRQLLRSRSYAAVIRKEDGLAVGRSARHHTDASPRRDKGWDIEESQCGRHSSLRVRSKLLVS
jgi:hypothetical protein